jgi:hypothetical protein
MAKVIANGNNPPTATNPPAHSICQIKLDKIVNKMWPAVMLPASRNPN